MIREHRVALYAVGAEPEPVDAMREPSGWLRSPTLGPVLRLCDEVLGQAYLDAEGDALESQTSHRHLVNLAAGAGLLALAIALVQFVLRARGVAGGHWAPPEFVAMGLAVATIALGIVTARQEEWIRKRHRAELIRALKFRLLIEPARWAGGPAQLERAEAWLRDELRKIGTLRRRDIALWSRREKAPHGPTPPSGRELARPLLRDLVRYYIDRRLRPQRGDVSRRSRPRGLAARIARGRLSERVFTLTAAALIGHLALERFAGGAPDWLSDTLLVCAALVPALGATLHALRLAPEIDRDRASAQEVSLQAMTTALKSAQSQEGILATLRACEQMLELEHREWLRRARRPSGRATRVPSGG
ncbi:MAG TPA: hypothetical protein VFO18_12490 [Methylomirabilota bacterium]|nr:hypothetical protein [Methylomirabilota bacterium]